MTDKYFFILLQDGLPIYIFKSKEAAWKWVIDFGGDGLTFLVKKVKESD